MRLASLFMSTLTACGGIEGTYALHHVRGDTSLSCGIFLADVPLVIDGDTVTLGARRADDVDISANEAHFSYSGETIVPGDGPATLRFTVTYSLHGDSSRLDGVADITTNLTRTPCPWTVYAD